MRNARKSRVSTNEIRIVLVNCRIESGPPQGPLRFRQKGRGYNWPFTSTILISLWLTLLLRAFRI